jgi:dTDP-4-amino-4,6-dideoxygalactose transaminase
MPETLPALLGGPPVRPDGPPRWPVEDDAILEALTAAYRDGSWGKYHGPSVERVEEQLSRYLGGLHVATCSSGTFAVELALRTLRIGPGDEVLLAAYDYPGNFLTIHALGAHPVLIDVHPDNWNLDPALVEKACGPKARAVLVSHLHGGLVPMAELAALAKRRQIAIIEDVAQAPGAWIESRQAGTWGDVSILSFGGSKLLTAGRGGALFTQSPEIHQRARAWQYRGNTLSPLSELQAAVLLPQITKLDERNSLRTKNVQALLQGVADVPGLLPMKNCAPDSRPVYYKVGFQFDAGTFGLSRKLFVSAMRAEGIAIDEGFAALHVQRSPSRFRKAGELLNADRAHAGMVVLHHPVLLGSLRDIDQVVQAVRKVYANVEQIRNWHGSSGPSLNP